MGYLLQQWNKIVIMKNWESQCMLRTYKAILMPSLCIIRLHELSISSYPVRIVGVSSKKNHVMLMILQ